jgi:CO/xanthine dehydrogenase FAD-binding subunit
MLRYNNYIFAKSLDEAYELNQKRNNTIIGGTGWLKLGNKQRGSVIDLSQLGLDQITEDEDSFKIGAMVTLRELELNRAINEYTSGAVKESLVHIVGTQFRNSVTVGGSIYGRFGFSDVLTVFIVADAYVELYKGGIIPLAEFAKMKYDNDILVNLIVKKKKMKLAYSSFRNQSTDFPVLTCAVSVCEDGITTAVGARPAKASIVGDEKNILAPYIGGILSGDEADGAELDKAVKEYSDFTAGSFKYESNLRASAEYREQLARVLIKRTIEKLELCKR